MLPVNYIPVYVVPCALTSPDHLLFRTLVIENVVLVQSVWLGLAQLCGVDLVHSKLLGDIPITVIAWAAPKIGNPYLAKWADDQHPKLRILRISVTTDIVTKGTIGFRTFPVAIYLDPETRNVL